MTAQRSPIIDLEQRRRGRPSMVVNDVLRGAIRIQREELLARQAEAVAFCDLLEPLVARFVLVAHEVGPHAMDTAVRAQRAVNTFRRRQDPRPERAA